MKPFNVDEYISLQRSYINALFTRRHTMHYPDNAAHQYTVKQYERRRLREAIRKVRQCRNRALPQTTIALLCGALITPEEENGVDGQATL